LIRHRKGSAGLSRLLLLLFAGIMLAPALVFAAGAGTVHGHPASTTFLWIAVLLLLARFAGMIERIGMPPVLGELLVGVILGNLGLIGIGWFEGVTADRTLAFLAELGVVILLFQIGLGSNIAEMKKVGVSATLVAIVGIVVPFALGTWVIGPWLLPGLHTSAYLFLGAALTATSVGITARVFQDLGRLRMPEAQTVLGAAVIDDVLGLIILAVVSAIATVGVISGSAVAIIAAKAVFFLAAAIIVGRLAAPRLGSLFSHAQAGLGMKLTLAISFCLLIAAFAEMIGLAPIVGAFAAGLVLDPVHFRGFRDSNVVEALRDALSREPEGVRQRVLGAIRPHAKRHVEELVEPLSYFLVPLFFVFTGMNVKLDVLFRVDVLLLAAGVTVAAIVGKALCGLAASPSSNRLLIGVGMIPRGEVGLIFAATGASLGVIDSRLYAIIVIMVIVTTLLPPPIIAYLIRRSPAPLEFDEEPQAPGHIDDLLPPVKEPLVETRSEAELALSSEK
jgi:Kef-type K+ transport system membrane component KefB